MRIEALAPLLTGLAAVLGGLRRLGGRSDRLRAKIKHDVELLALLPDDSEARGAVREHIDESVRRLLLLEQDAAGKRNDPAGIGVAAFLLALAGSGTYYVAAAELPLVVDVLAVVIILALAALGVVGLAVSIRQKPKPEQERNAE